MMSLDNQNFYVNRYILAAKTSMLIGIFYLMNQPSL